MFHVWFGGRHPALTICIALSGFALLIIGALIPCLKRCRKSQDAVAPEDVEENLVPSRSVPSEAVSGSEGPVITGGIVERTQKNFGSAAG